MNKLESFSKKFVDALYNEEFGVVFSRTRTKIKQFKKLEGDEILITYKDVIDKKLGIQILYDYSRKSYEIKFRGKDYKKIAQRIEKYLKNNQFVNGTIQEI